MLIAYYGFLICLVTFVASVWNEKNFINPIAVFSFVWGLIFLFSPMCLYTLYLPHDDTYLCILIGVVCFFCGALLANFFKMHRYSFGQNDNGCAVRYRLRYQLVYVFLIVDFIYFAVFFSLMIKTVGLYNLANVQSSLQNGDFIMQKSKILSAVSNLIIYPTTQAAPAIAAADFWFGAKDKKLMLLTVAVLFIKMLANANRSGFMVFFIYMILLALVYYKSSKGGVRLSPKMKKKIKKYIVLFLVLGSIIFGVLTFFRGADVVSNVYKNLAMPPMMFEIWRDVVDKKNLFGYGTASLNGFFNSLFYVLKNLLGLDSMPVLVQQMYDAIMQTDVDWKWIGTRIVANAYVSVFWFFYLDGRLWGVCLGSVVFGAISYAFYKKMMISPNARNAGLYCLIFYSILYSFVRFQFSQMSFFLAFLFILFFYKKIREKQ